MSQKRTLLVAALAAFALMAGCGKKNPIAPTTPGAPTPIAGGDSVTDPNAGMKPNGPTISEFVAEPGSILRGQSATLRWSVSNAAEITAEPGIGTLPASGTRSVYPSANTTYTLKASGPGGTITASATVTVTNPDIPPPLADPNANRGRDGNLTLSQRLERDVKDVYFDYDRNDLRADAITIMTTNAAALKAILRDFPTASVTVEGHSDERGSAEYNLGLGDRRGQSAQDFLLQQGIPADRLRLISYGKERPQCTDANETCWGMNRRVHLVAGIQ